MTTATKPKHKERRMPDKLTTLPVSELKRNPTSKELYGPEELDEQFLESVSRGIKNPLQVRERDKLVIDGGRRLAAAKRIGIKEVPVVLGEFDDDLEMKLFMLDANQYRVKTNEQRSREIALRHEIEKKKAAARQKASQFGAKNEAKPEEANGQQKVEEPEETGDALEIAARSAGWTAPTARKAIEIVRAIDSAEKAGKPKKAQRIRDALAKSVESGHREITPKKPSLSEKPEKPEPSSEQPWRNKDQPIRDRISSWNAYLEEIAQSVVHAADGLHIYGRMNKSQRDIIFAELKKVSGMIRACKAKVQCPKCEGKGCTKCNNAGMCTEREAATAGK